MVLMAPEKSCPNQGRFFVVYKNEKKETPLPCLFRCKKAHKDWANNLWSGGHRKHTGACNVCIYLKYFRWKCIVLWGRKFVGIFVGHLWGVVSISVRLSSFCTIADRDVDVCSSALLLVVLVVIVKAVLPTTS